MRPVSNKSTGGAFEGLQSDYVLDTQRTCNLQGSTGVQVLLGDVFSFPIWRHFSWKMQEGPNAQLLLDLD